MFTASLYFLGIAASICAALFFLATGKRAEKSVEAETGRLHAASIDSSTERQMTLGDLSSSMCQNLPSEEKARLSDWKSLWVQSYIHVKRKAFLKQKAMYSWARTMALCAGLCLLGIVLKVELDERMSASQITSGFTHQHPVATNSQTPQLKPSGSTSNAPKEGTTSGLTPTEARSAL